MHGTRIMYTLIPALDNFHSDTEAKYFPDDGCFSADNNASSLQESRLMGRLLAGLDSLIHVLSKQVPGSSPADQFTQT